MEKQIPIEVYIAYEYLPLKQQAKILESISDIYEAVLEASVYSFPSRYRFLYPVIYKGHYPPYPPLCIYSANTGESINLKFDVDNKVLPKLVFNDGDLDILFPQWTAAAFITGSLLVGGLNGYKDHLEIQKLQKELEQMEVDKIQENPISNKIESCLNLFNYEINQYNIKKVIVNNHKLKDTE